MNLCDVIVRNIGENKHILLIGGGGAGKTYQFAYAYKNIADMSINNNKIIPLYIPMNKFNDTETFIRDYIIREYIGEIKIAENISVQKKLKETIEKTNYQFCFFIDAIDETSALKGKALYEIKELSEWNNVTIVLSTRNIIEHLSNFAVFKVNPINDELLEKEVEDYHALNTKLKDLIKIPFYYKKYNEIKKEDKKNITSEAELLTLYYEWVLEKTYESVNSSTYHDECDLLLNEFMPSFAHEQMNKIFYMLFDCVEINKLWNVFKMDYGINLIDNCIDVLEKFGIIRKNGRIKYSFVHQNIYTYFAAKYIVDKIEAEQGEGDRLLNQVSDVYILRMIGELLDEHHYKTKKSIDEKKSPVEGKLDKYRGVYDDNAAEIVSKYIDIMKICRNNECTADYSFLDLRKTRLYSKGSTNYENSNFNYCKISWMSFEQPFMGNDIEFVYADEDNDYLIVSDLKTKVFFLNGKLEVIDVIESVTEMPIYGTKKNNISLDILTDSVRIQILWEKYDGTIHTECKEKTVSHCSHNNVETLLKIENGYLSYKHENVVAIAPKDSYWKEMVGKVYGIGLKKWNVVSTSMTIGIDVDKYEYRNHLVKRNIRRLYSRLSTSGFTLLDNTGEEEFVEGHLAIQGNYSGQIYDTVNRCCTLYYQHDGADMYMHRICDMCYVKTVTYAFGMDGCSKVCTYKYVGSSEPSDIEVVVPTANTILATNVCEKYLLMYNGSKIYYLDISKCCHSSIEGVDFFAERLVLENIDLNVDGEILFNGCKIIDDVLYVVYKYIDGYERLALIMYDLLKCKIIKKMCTNVTANRVNFMIGQQTFSGKESTCNLLIMRDYIYFKNYEYLYIIDVQTGWHFSIYLPEINIKNVVGIHVFEGGIFLFQNDNCIIKCLFERMIKEKEYYSVGTWGELVVENGKNYIKKHECYDEIFKREVDGFPCIEIVKECEIKYLDNMKLQGCSFIEAKLIGKDNIENPIGEDILFNT